MSLAYTAPTWTDGSGTGISASQLQALCDCVEGLVQGSDTAVSNIGMNASVITLTFADGTQETVNATNMKSISSIAKTGTLGLVDTYTITYTDGSTGTFTVTNGAAGQAPTISMTATADATSSPNPSVTVTKTGSDASPNFALAFSGLKGAKGDTGATGQNGQDGQDGVSPEVTIGTITGGHSVTITDADHPTGQTFNVMDGDAVSMLEQTTYTDVGDRRYFTFTDAAITTTAAYDYYCDVYGVVPESVNVSTEYMDVIFKVSDNVTRCRLYVRG